MIDMIGRNHVSALLLGMLLWSGIAQAIQKEAYKPENTLPKSKKSQKRMFASIDIYGGLTQFYGELNEQDMKSMMGIGAHLHLNRKIEIVFNYTSGKLGGQKRNFLNSYFINEYNTWELATRWSISQQFLKNANDPVDFGVYGGVGLVVFSAHAYDLKTGELVRFTNSNLSARNPLFLRWGPPKGPAGIKKTHEGILPVGMNIAYGGKARLKVGIDFRFYFIRTDKADATSGQRLVNPEEADSYSNTPNDKFSFIAVSMSYRFSKLPGKP
jgi:hypothetical protein